MQVRLFWGSVDGEDGVNNIGGELLSKSMVQLGGEGGTSNRKEQLAVNGTLKLEVVKELGQPEIRIGKPRKYVK